MRLSQSREAFVVLGVDIFDCQNLCSWGAFRFMQMKKHLSPNHQPGQFIRLVL
jgi:hypothetical protein